MIYRFLKKLKEFIRVLIGAPKPEPTVPAVEIWRRYGAIIGEKVDLIECNINLKDVKRLEIGSNVTCVYVHFLTHDASLNKFIGNDCNKIGKIVIGNNVFIGLKSIILPNVHIGSNVVIGAGSVITKDIPSNSVAVGNPAKVICTCDEYIEKHKKRMQENPDLVLWNVHINDMSKMEFEEYNKKIDKTLVYEMENDNENNLR